MSQLLITVVYIFFGSWILSRVIAFIIQWLLKKYLDVTLTFGKFGLLNFGKVQMTLKRHVSVHVEVEKLWLSSSFFNQEIRKPLVVCVEDMRIQVDVSSQGERDTTLAQSTGQTRDKQRILRLINKIIVIASYGGLRINNVTVMLLKTMVPNCLIHFTSPEISLDVTAAYDKYELCANISNFGCRALRSSPEPEESGEQPNCLAEFSLTLKTEAKVDKLDPAKVTVLKTVVTKPQMMITEGFLQNLQNIKRKSGVKSEEVSDSERPRPVSETDFVGEHERGEAEDSVHWPNDMVVSKLKAFEHLQDVSFDIADLDVKIVRETKQRSLHVSLKLFHLGFHNQSFWSATDMNCNVYLEEFNTSSMQAKFAGLTKVIVKGQLLRDSLDTFLTVSSGFFHYHHEEVQYWMLVFTNILHQTNPPAQQRQQQHLPAQPEQGQQQQQQQDQRRSSPLILRRSRSKPSPTLLSWMVNKNFSIVLELTDISSIVSTAACSGLNTQVSQARINASVKPGGPALKELDWYSLHNVGCEVDVQNVSCCLTDVKLPLQDMGGKKHYWGHVIYLGTFLMKLKKFNSELKVDVMKDNIQLEWSSSLYNALGQLIAAIQKGRPGYQLSTTRQVGSSRSSVVDHGSILSPTSHQGGEGERRLTAVVKCDVSNINMFVTNSIGVSVMTRIDSVSFNHSHFNTSLSVEGTKLHYIVIDQQQPFFRLSRSSEIHQPVLFIHQVNLKYVPANKECRVHVLQQLAMQWTTECHLCLVQGLQDARTLYTKLRGWDNEDCSETVRVSRSQPAAVAKPKWTTSVNVLVLADINLQAKLSKQHVISIFTTNLLVTMTLPEMLMEVKEFSVKCDGHDVFHITGFQLETLPVSHLTGERESAKILCDATNRAWGVSFDSIDIVFPYKYNFASCYEEVMNTVKWLKLVHKVKKKPFTAQSPLPPDLCIRVKMLSIELSDDPFEVKMGLNYELLKDEGIESKKRREVLDGKLTEMQKRQFIPVNKREELYSSLDKKSSEIYIQRSHQLYTEAPIRTQLLTWLMEDLSITAMADSSFNGKDNVIKKMKEIDPESPFPKEPVEFVTLWCRYVKAGVNLWSVSLRDFPRPMIDVSAMHVWGRLVGAEREGTKRAKRTCEVEMMKPYEPMKVERNLPALKFFHDFSCDTNSFIMAYGVCWEPAVALYNLSMDLINRPSVDPSKPLPFWDKMRVLFHGRLTMSIASMSWLYHASLDPYNNTELMDWTWSKLLLDWKNAQFILQGDLEISVRTASKYNESRLLHLPNLTFRVGLEWLCLGNANDHHSVMPCAPDKVPDFSLEEHDSFRAFRSQNLNLDLSLKTKPVAGDQDVIPSCPELYASTLRFLEKIKQCMFSVTRPVRRGKLFGVTANRRLQLTRHYKKIKLTVDFHKFKTCHWMSNAKEHGAELMADSFVLQMCNRLNLVPLEDGLLHRPRADWSIKTLKIHLGPSRISLCKNVGKDESGVLSASAERSFFLSINKISYQRADRRNRKKTEEADKQRTPTHSVSIHEMKGAWNQFNRTVVIGLYDSYNRAKALRRNLSSEALKGFKVDTNTPNVTKNRSFSLSNADLIAGAQGGGGGASSSGSDPVSPSPLSKLQSGHAHTMLLKLVSESDSKSVAFTEEPSDNNLTQLHGVQACKLTDILQTNWQIEIHNSQVVCKGSEAPGYVIVSAARAKIMSYTHTPIWRQGQLRSKSTWNGDVDCMQYYATVDPNSSYEGDNIPWLSKENVEDRVNTDLSGLPEMISSGQLVGSVVSSVVSGAAASNGADQGPASEPIQLQRIIYRCSCKFFYANYGEVDPNMLPEVPLPPGDETDVMSTEEGVDTFTLLHESVYAYSNHLQFSVIMDIVNNLLLYVEPKKKEASDRLQSMRFKLQLYRDEDQKTPILQQQEELRGKVQALRQLEKEYYISKRRDDEERMEDLEVKMEELKNTIGLKNEELGMRISCYNESQLQVKAQMKMERAQQAQVVRRNEVCFKYAKWRMTERDGHCGIAELELRNFVYSKVNRDDDSWTHLMELNWVKVENLLADNFYQKVLVPRDGQVQDGENRQMALRITCTERPPVGGIPVKEHFEVNVAPIHIQMTYQFYKAVMEFFFPDKNVDMDDDDDVEVKQKKEKKNNKKERDKKKEEEEKNALRSGPSFSSADDINKMRERAAKNNTFLYIKIPQVVARVSYKGQKEKNIADVHDFSFILPTVEYHNCIWTWFDFLITLKNHSKRTLLSQAIKQKLHWKARYLEETPHSDVQEEEDKAKMLLGAKLLAGQDKPTKKGFFGKSHKS